MDDLWERPDYFPDMSSLVIHKRWWIVITRPLVDWNIASWLSSYQWLSLILTLVKACCQSLSYLRWLLSFVLKPLQILAIIAFSLPFFRGELNESVLTGCQTFHYIQWSRTLLFREWNKDHNAYYTNCLILLFPFISILLKLTIYPTAHQLSGIVFK